MIVPKPICSEICNNFETIYPPKTNGFCRQTVHMTISVQIMTKMEFQSNAFSCLKFQREQLAQKQEKQDRTKLHRIVSDYSGSWFPITAGCGVCCCPPLTDDPRIPVKKGDHINVTRGTKYELLFCASCRKT